MVERRARGVIDGWRVAHPPARPGPAARTATGSLARLLHILPAASGEGGARLSELARDLGVDEATVVADVVAVQEREFYLPTSLGSQIQVTLATDRVSVWTTGELRRPARLAPREALALGLGLRMAGLSPIAGSDPEGRERLRRRLEGALASAPADALEAFVRAPELETDPAGIRGALARAARERTVCRIRYVKAGRYGPEERRIRPYALVMAEGLWYALSHCERADAVRSFRLDRVVEVRLLGERFEVPASFDPIAHLGGGRVFQASGARAAVVRYAPRIARWIAEREVGEWQEDRAFVVRHPVADAGWLVRHILGYAGDAEVMEPPELRAAVRNAALRLAETSR